MRKRADMGPNYVSKKKRQIGCVFPDVLIDHMVNWIVELCTEVSYKFEILMQKSAGNLA